MAYPQARSCNTALHLGSTDGTYKAYAMNRGGMVVEDGHTDVVRKQMSGVWHGFHEAPTRVCPDGRTFTSPYYVDMTPEDPENV